ncbi:MAG: hypothetical protein IKR97_00935, partial [Eubacterium sp.]|nr:hypothetical protein [Eubacterium sp.]
TVNLDNDAFDAEDDSITTAKSVVADLVPTSTVSYGTSTIKVVDDEVSQENVNLAISDILTALANSVKTYTIDVTLNGDPAGNSVEISANGSTIYDNKVTYGSKLTLTNKASNPDETAWYMNFDSSAVGEGKRTEQYIGEGSRVKTTTLGNMHIRAVSKTVNTPNKVTVKRKYKGDSTKSPIVCVDYVGSSYTLPASQVIPGYTFNGYTYENGGEIEGSTASISGNTVIIANYSQSESVQKYDVVVKDERGKVIDGYDFTGSNAVPYNTKVEVSYPNAAGWVERVDGKDRLFHIGSDLTFFVTESHEIRAITSLDGYTYPVINIKNSAPIVTPVDGGKKKIIFNAQVISGSANVLEYGILLARNETSDSELVVENAGSTTGILRAKSTKLVGADQFTISVTTASSGTVSYRAYATYQVGEGESAEIITVYTDVKTATV